MSYFAVTIETIDKIVPIPNADNIVQAFLKGIDFSFVVKKNQFKDGDKCLYIPLDSILSSDLLKKIGLEGKLGGGQKNRVKTIKLRGVISQGIATDLSIIDELLKKNSKPSPDEITKFLDVIKYEPDEVKVQEDTKTKWSWHKILIKRIFGKRFVTWLYGRKSGSLVPLNTLGIPVYDIESCQRYKEVVEYLMDKKVYVTLKMEGQNASVLCRKNKIYVNQRRFTITKDTSNTLWGIVTKLKLDLFAKMLSKKYKKEALVYFEACGSDNGSTGISGNIYKFKEYKSFIFDIKIGESYLDKPIMIKEVEEYFKGRDMLVPILCEGDTLSQWLTKNDYESVEKAAEQKGIVNKFGNCLEEGIVITPEKEEIYKGLGRILLKYRSKIYLANES